MTSCPPASAGYSKGYHAVVAMIEPERIPLIVEALLADGWNESDLRGLLGQNNPRVAQQVWK